MPITTNPEWQQLALYAGAAALMLILLFNIPRIGPVIRGGFSLTLLGWQSTPGLTRWLALVSRIDVPTHDRNWR